MPPTVRQLLFRCIHNQVQVTGGLAEGDTVALPTDVPLANGTRVTPVM